MDTILAQIAKVTKAPTTLADFIRGHSEAITAALSTLVRRPTIHQPCQTDMHYNCQIERRPSDASRSPPNIRHATPTDLSSMHESVTRSSTAFASMTRSPTKTTSATSSTTKQITSLKPTTSILKPKILRQQSRTAPSIQIPQQGRLRQLFRLRRAGPASNSRKRRRPFRRPNQRTTIDEMEAHIQQLNSMRAIPPDYECPVCAFKVLHMATFGRSRNVVIQHLYTHVPRSDCVYRCPGLNCDYAAPDIFLVGRHFTRRHGTWTPTVAASCPYGPNLRRHRALFQTSGSHTATPVA